MSKRKLLNTINILEQIITLNDNIANNTLAPIDEKHLRDIVFLAKLKLKAHKAKNTRKDITL